MSLLKDYFDKYPDKYRGIKNLINVSRETQECRDKRAKKVVASLEYWERVLNEESE